MVKAVLITPVYSTEQNSRLPLLLQSIYWARQQTFKDFVHVVVNDGSTDETPELLERIARHAPSMRVYHKPNGGSSSAMNLGFERAASEFNPEFVTFCHSDDLLPPMGLAQRVSSAEATNSQFVFSDIIIFYEKSRATSVKSAPDLADADSLYRFLLNQKNINFPTMLWDRRLFEKIGGFDPEITSAEDWDIALRTARELRNSGGLHLCVHEPTHAYRIHDNNITYENNKDGTTWKCYKRLLRKHFEGRAYYLNLLKAGLMMYRAMLPEPVKKPLRGIRDMLLSSGSPLVPYRDEFLEEMRKVDYMKELLTVRRN